MFAASFRVMTVTVSFGTERVYAERPASQLTAHSGQETEDHRRRGDQERILFPMLFITWPRVKLVSLVLS